MNEEIKVNSEPERIDPQLAKRELRRTYNRCGWILFAYTVLGFVLSRLIESFIRGSSDEIKTLFNQNILIFNAIFVCTETLIAVLLLRFLPKSAPERRKILPKEYVKMIFVAFGVSYIGSMISRFVINFVYYISGFEISDRVSAAIGSVSPWQAILCSALIAPLIEEFLFRKVLIDRLYKHGELVAILTSAVIFGLFHQNVYQIVYATGAGLVLGYLYCKTGSYLATSALHMIFNLIGVIPTFFTSKLMDYANMTQEEIANLPAHLAEQYTSAMTGYMIYSLIIFAINVAGVIILIINRKKFSITNNAPALLESDKREIAWRAPGIVATAVAMILLTVYSLFV